MNESTLAKRTRVRTPNNRTTTGFRVSDALWAVLEPLIPVRVNTHRFGGGRPRIPDRRCADAIFYVLRTDCQWEALSQTGLCAKSTAHDRFQEWVAAGVFLKLWHAGVEQFDELEGIDWSWLSMDGALTKAPLGGEKDGAESDRPRHAGRQAQSADRGARGAAGWRSTVPRHDMKLVRATLDSIVVERPEVTPDAPQGMCLDKGYDYDDVRATLEEFGFTAHIKARGCGQRTQG